MGPFTSERTKEDLLTVARQNGWIMEGDAELLSALYDKAMAKNDLGLEMLLDDIYSLQVPQRYMREYMMDHYIEILGGEYYAEEREMLKQLRNGWRRDVGTFYGHDYDDLHSYIEKNTGAFALSEDFQNSKRNSAAFRIRCQAMGWVQEGDDKLVDAVYDAFLDPHHMNPALKTEAQAVLYLMMNMPVNNEDHRRQMLNLMQDVWNIAVGATKKDNVPMVDYFKPEEKVISDLNTRIQGARSVKRLPQQEFDKRMDAARRAPALKEWSKEGQERSIKERMDERRKFRDKSDRWQKQIREEQQRKLNEEEERQRQEQERIERERAEARKAQLLKEAEELRKRLEAEKAAYDAQKYSPIPEVPLNVSYTGKRTATSANDPEGKLYHTEDAALVLSTQLFMTYMQAFPLLEKEGNIDRIAPITAYIAANPIKDVHQKKYDNFDGGKVKMFDFNATVYSEDTQQLKDMLKTLEDTFTELADKAKDPGIKESYQSLAYICRTDQGNFARAMEENPLLQGLKAVSIMGVRNSEEYPEEECIKGLKGQHPSQAHLPEEQRIDISADVFTLQGAFGRELKLEYRRQQLERGGYADRDACEQYKKDLVREHKRTIEAFDRLCRVDNRGQYDEFMMNPLDERLNRGNKAQNRGISFQVGYMRGEMQAIEMGWGIEEMCVLGMIGGIEGDFDKYYSQYSKIEDPIKKQQKLDELAALRAPFNSIKEECWNMQVNPEDPEAKRTIVNKLFSYIHENRNNALLGHSRQFGEGLEKLRAGMNEAHINTLEGADKKAAMKAGFDNALKSYEAVTETVSLCEKFEQTLMDLAPVPETRAYNDLGTQLSVIGKLGGHSNVETVRTLVNALHNKTERVLDEDVAEDANTQARRQKVNELKDAAKKILDDIEKTMDNGVNRFRPIGDQILTLANKAPEHTGDKFVKYSSDVEMVTATHKDDKNGFEVFDNDDKEIRLARIAALENKGKDRKAVEESARRAGKRINLEALQAGVVDIKKPEKMPKPTVKKENNPQAGRGGKH